MNKITPQPGILDIAIYQSGAAHVAGVSNVVKLSSNENPLGPSPRAIEAMQAAATQMNRYPSSDHSGLRRAIGEVHGLNSEQIICGAGSDEIIAFLCQCYAGPGDEVLYTEHGFSMYRISALAAGATPVEVRERERVTDVDALLDGCTDRTKLVFIANPNNPTGTMISEGEVARLADGLPEGALLVLDGAYAEYVEGFDAGAALIKTRSNIIMTRTFSKLYGLGGARIGWGYGPAAIIDVLNRVRGPFNVSSTALAAAEASIRDLDYVATCRAENAKWRGWLAETLAEVGVSSDISCTNFILARFGSQAEAEACDLYLQKQGLIVRRVTGYKLPEALRITIGDETSCRQLAQAVKDFKNGAK
jgi:histidinol-phosphate aminotransferase